MKESIKEMRRQVIDWEKIFAKAIPYQRVTGRKARGLQMEKIGCKCQTFFFISPLNSRKTQTLHGNFLSYVNETMYLLWNLPFFKMASPETIFSFLKPWADNNSTNQYSYQLLYGWGMTHLVPSCFKTSYFGRGLVKLIQP